MIEGLKLKVPHTELTQHCLDRAQYHRDRADAKERQIPELKENAKAMTEAIEKLAAATNQNPENVARMSKSGASYNFSPEAASQDINASIAQLETDVKNHRNRALALEFIGKHLFAEDYNLSQNDLIGLEILGRH